MTKLNHAHQIVSGTTLAAAWLLVTAVSTWAATPLGTAFTYQGRLESGGAPINDTCDFEFSLWYDAGGVTQVGVTQTISGVTVTDGLLAVELNGSGEFGADAFNGDQRWLRIAVRCPPDASFTTLSPLQPLTAAPYAQYAQSAGGGFWATDTGFSIYNTNAGRVGIGIGTVSPSARLHVEAGAGSSVAIRAFSAVTGGSGIVSQISTISGEAVHGEATSPNGTTYGVLGRSAGDSGRGVVGEATSSSGGTTGVSGQSSSVSGRGVSGFAAASSGINYGVWGQTNSPSGYSGYFPGVAGSRNYFQRNVGIGTVSPSEMLQVAGNVRATGSVFASCGTLSCSDARYKTDIKPVAQALEKLQQLCAVTFNWKREEYPDHEFRADRQMGLIAQEVREVLPEVVQEGRDGYLSVDYGRLTPLLIEAVKEQQRSIERQQKEIEEKKTQLAEQRGRMSELEGRLARLERLISHAAVEKENSQ